MESVDGYRVNEEIPPEREEVVSFRYDPVPRQTQVRETPSSMRWSVAFVSLNYDLPPDG
jgi:hypothetical protein